MKTHYQSPPPGSGCRTIDRRSRPASAPQFHPTTLQSPGGLARRSQDMRFITSLVLSFFVAHCTAEGDVVWDSKSEKSQLTLETGPMEKRWGGTGTDELFFRVKDGTRTLFSWGMVGPVVGLIQEGLAMNARGKTIEISNYSGRKAHRNAREGGLDRLHQVHAVLADCGEIAADHTKPLRPLLAAETA